MPEKKIRHESFSKIKEMVDFMNAARLTKDSIISIVPKEELFFLIYVK